MAGKNNRQRTNYTNNGGSKSKKGLIGVIAAFTASALILGAAVGVMGYGTDGFKDWSFNNFSHKTEYTAPIETETGGAIVSDGESKGISLMSTRIAPEEYADYGIDTQSVENVFNLSVTYTPANTTFQQTTYTIAFKNPNSTWAQGKNVSDYATVTQSASGSKDAQLKILKPFSEQLVVTARSQRNSSLYAKTVVDYVCTDLSVGMPTGRLDVGSTFAITGYKWSNGTVAPESANHITLVVDLWEGIVKHMQSYGFEINQYYTLQLSEEALNNDEDIDDFLSMLYAVGGYSSLSPEQKSRYTIAINDYYCDFADGEGIFSYYFTYDRIYNGVDYGGFETEISDMEAEYFTDVFEVRGESMTTNNGHIVAG